MIRLRHFGAQIQVSLLTLSPPPALSLVVSPLEKQFFLRFVLAENDIPPLYCVSLFERLGRRSRAIASFSVSNYHTVDRQLRSDIGSFWRFLAP